MQVHLEQVKKHEHNLEQQKMMLADVQLRLESVRLEVRALRALVAETKEPEGPQIQAPPPCPGEPPPEDVDETPPTIDLDMMAPPLDSDDDDMEERDAEPWKTVGSYEKRSKVPVVMKLKGTPASARKGSLRQNFLDKTCIIENDRSWQSSLEAFSGWHQLKDICLASGYHPRLRRYTKFKRALPVRVRAREMGLSSSVGDASSFLCGIQARRVSFNGPCVEVSGPQSAKPGLFFWRTRLLFYRCCGRYQGLSETALAICWWEGQGGPGCVWHRCFGVRLVLLARLSRSLRSLVRSSKSFVARMIWTVRCPRFRAVRMIPTVSRWFFLGSLPKVLVALHLKVHVPLVMVIGISGFGWCSTVGTACGAPFSSSAC